MRFSLVYLLITKILLKILICFTQLLILSSLEVQWIIFFHNINTIFKVTATCFFKDIFMLFLPPSDTVKWSKIDDDRYQLKKFIKWQMNENIIQRLFYLHSWHRDYLVFLHWFLPLKLPSFRFWRLLSNLGVKCVYIYV